MVPGILDTASCERFWSERAMAANGNWKNVC